MFSWVKKWLQQSKHLKLSQAWVKLNLMLLMPWCKMTPTWHILIVYLLQSFYATRNFFLVIFFPSSFTFFLFFLLLCFTSFFFPSFFFSFFSPSLPHPMLCQQYCQTSPAYDVCLTAWSEPDQNLLRQHLKTSINVIQLLGLCNLTTEMVVHVEAVGFGRDWEFDQSVIYLPRIF